MFAVILCGCVCSKFRMELNQEEKKGRRLVRTGEGRRGAGRRGRKLRGGEWKGEEKGEGGKRRKGRGVGGGGGKEEEVKWMGEPGEGRGGRGRGMARGRGKESGGGGRGEREGEGVASFPGVRYVREKSAWCVARLYITETRESFTSTKHSSVQPSRAVHPR